MFTKAVSKPTTATLVVEHRCMGHSRAQHFRRRVGKAAALTASDTGAALSLTINGFSDELGNAGQEQRRPVRATPVIQVTEPG
ncbi:hypothetical protein O9993_15175 [Vibrio lentus]|nr:hypothetical protein [Vibrio lentus]